MLKYLKNKILSFWFSSISIGVDANDSRTEIKRINLLNIFCLGWMLRNLIDFTDNLIRGDRSFILILRDLILMSLIIVVILILHRKRKLFAARLTLIIAMALLAFIYANFIYPSNMIEYYFFTVPCVAIIFFDSIRINLIILLATFSMMYYPNYYFHHYPENTINSLNIVSVFFNVFIVVAYLKILNEKNEKDLIKKSLELEELNKFKSKVFTNISHEFKTPLTLISGPIENQLNKDNLLQKDKEELLSVKRNSNRLLQLVNQMLDLSILDSGHLKLNIKNGNLYLLLQQHIAAFKYKFETRGITIDSQLDPKLNDTWFDDDAMQKIASNLLSNANKYSPSNEKIIFSAIIENETIVITISNKTNSNSTLELDHFFERFYQSNINSEGIGVGLALVKELVTAQKGTINVDFKDNRIRFIVKIPVQQSNKKEIISNSEEVEQLVPYSNNQTDIDIETNEDNNTILIVEDNDELRNFIASVFIDKYNIIQAKNGIEGEDIALKTIPDIILSDIMMPKASGIDLCNALKHNEITSHIPIILLTAKSGDTNEIEGLKIGADAYITKPFKIEKLKITVKNILDNRNALKNYYSKSQIIPPELITNSTENKFLERLNKTLKANISNPNFNTENFHTEMQMSRMQLHRKIKALTNMTTSEFLRSQRLKLALHLLKNESLTISEIAYETGFNTPSYFSKSFKELYKVSPKEYIKNLNGQ